MDRATSAGVPEGQLHKEVVLTYRRAILQLRGASTRVAALNDAVRYSDCERSSDMEGLTSGAIIRPSCVPSYRPDHPPKSKCVTNYFARLALEVIGGGAARLGRNAAQTAHVTSGAGDIIRGLAACMRGNVFAMLDLNVVEVATAVFGRGMDIPFVWG